MLTRNFLLFHMMLFSLLLLLAGCAGQNASEKIYTHLEEAVQLEEDFEQQQEAITDLEREEQQIYSEIIELGMDEFDKIVNLSDQAIEIIEERRKLIDKEKESIKKSEETFLQIEPLLNDLKEEKLQQKGETMFHVMQDRYASYDELHAAYLASLELEKELYEMLKDEDLEQETLTEQINKINDSYKQVLEINDEFNELTIEYNNLKKEFYELAELDVSLEND
mgnify:FL=1